MTGSHDVAAVEDPQVSPEVLTDARVWMQAARVWAVERYPYLDTALMSMILVPRPGHGTVSVDARWRLYYDPARVVALEGSHGIEVLAADWLHEVMHLLRDHPARWEDLREAPVRFPRWNMAADAFVNADVEDCGLPLLPTDVTFERLPREADCRRDMATEEVYARLGQLAQEPSGTGEPGRTGASGEDAWDAVHDCGSGAGGPQRPWEESLSDHADDGSVDAGRADLIREQTAQAVQHAARAGRVPGGLERWAGELLRPGVDWRAELRSVVTRHLGWAAGVRDYSYGRLARRRIPGFTLPGMVGPASPRVAAVVDTSGSMSADDLAACLAELVGISRAVAVDNPGVSVLLCDAEVHDVVRLRAPGQVAQLRLVGGGGTDMTRGLEAAAALKPRPEVVVVLTDGHTPWPRTAPDGLEGALVVAVLTQSGARKDVPGWIRVIVREVEE